MAAALRKFESAPASFVVPKGVSPPPLIGNQHFVLFNIAHERHIPTSTKPAMRLLGTFATEEEARAMVPENPPISYFISPTHRFVPLTSGPEVETSSTVATIVKLHEEALQKNNKDFDDMIEKKREGTIGKSVTTLRARSTRTRYPRETKELPVAKPCPPVTGDRCLAGQNFAVIVILQDIRPESLSGDAPLEPLIAVLFAGGTLDEAEQYAKYTASKEYPNNDTLIVDMYKWLHPEHVNFRDVASESADERVTAISNKKRNDKIKVAELALPPECVLEVTGRPEDSIPGALDEQKEPAISESDSGALETKAISQDDSGALRKPEMSEDDIDPKWRKMFEGCK